MTVCIAAVCESAQKIVVAADRMLTYTFPTNLEFETEEDKIDELAPSCIALISGNTGYSTEIIEKSRKKIGGNPTPEIGNVLDTVRNEYAFVRMAKIDETITSSMLGIDYVRFLQKGGILPNYLQVQVQVFQQLTMLSQNFNLNVEMIIAGIDETGAHISVLTHPGTLFSLAKLGYGSIGSGGIHATIFLSLNGQTSRKPFSDTLYNVYAAKKTSEAAPGVGQATDIAVVESGRVFRCRQPILDELERLFLKSTKKSLPNFEALEKIYHEQHTA